MNSKADGMGDASNHGQLMNAIYARQRYFYDVTRKFFLLGRDRLIDDLAVPEGGSVLEVACGTGRNLARIGQRYPKARLYGFDISTEMLATAEGTIARSGLKDRTELRVGDATDFDPSEMYGVQGFDRIVISYALSMIPDWDGALEEAARHLNPGGALCVVDFGDQARLPGWFRRGLLAWLGKFHVAPRLALEDALVKTAEGINGRAEFRPLYRGFAWIGAVRA